MVNYWLHVIYRGIPYTGSSVCAVLLQCVYFSHKTSKNVRGAQTPNKYWRKQTRDPQTPHLPFTISVKFSISNQNNYTFKSVINYNNMYILCKANYFYLMISDTNYYTINLIKIKYFHELFSAFFILNSFIIDDYLCYIVRYG